MRPGPDPDHSEEDSDDADRGKRAQRNPYRSTTNAPQECTDSDSPEEADGLGERSQSLKKACWPSTYRGGDELPADTAAVPSAARAVGSPPPFPQPYTSRAASRPRHRGVARQRNFKQRAAVVRTKPLAAPTRSAEPPRPSGRQRPKQKRWERTPATDPPDQADAAQRPTKRPHRANPEAPPEELWDTWRRMEPRRKRRT